MNAFPESAAERYDRALHLARKGHLPKNYPVPRPSTEWPRENIAFLEEYRTWLYDGGLSVNVIQQLYIPAVGHVLGLALKPYEQLDLEVDLARVLDYLKAKHASEEWTHNSGIALEKFRQFMRLQRGQVAITFQPMGRDRYVQDLPAWLIEYLDRYHRVMESHWRPARSNQRSLRFWSCHTSVWHWICQQRSITRPDEVKRQDLLDYVDRQLELKYAASTINNHLRSFHAFLLYLQEHDLHIPAALLRIPVLKEPDRLPRYLTEEEVRRVRDDFERRVREASYPAQRRDALLDRAAFYLMWQAGLRLGEVEELRLEDLDLSHRKLMVRQGKNRKDRAIYLTDTIVRTLQEYLTMRGQGEVEHVFLYRHREVQKDLLHCRIKYAGERAGVKVTPHRLRHTCATQLLNAGCKITSIQQLFGHREISTTLIYARVHDQTVADDYYAAMQRIERSLEITAKSSSQYEVVKEQTSLDLFTHAQLLNLIDQLAEPQLDTDVRLSLIEHMRGVLKSSAPHAAMVAA